MPVTARERAEKALEKLNAEIEKVQAKHDRLAERARLANESQTELSQNLKALVAERDHLARHPALKGPKPKAVAPARTEDPFDADDYGTRTGADQQPEEANFDEGRDAEAPRVDDLSFD